jgi:hypothetical protein
MERFRRRAYFALAVPIVLVLVLTFGFSFVEGVISAWILVVFIPVYIVYWVYWVLQIYLKRCPHCSRGYFVRFGLPVLVARGCQRCRQPG